MAIFNDRVHIYSLFVNTIFTHMALNRHLIDLICH